MVVELKLKVQPNLFFNSKLICIEQLDQLLIIECKGFQ